MIEPIKLNDVYPWGHNLAEYKAIFNLDDMDIRRPLVGFADGTSSVNSELTQLGHKMVSVDPIYQFTKQDIDRRLNDVMAQSEQYWRGLPEDHRQQAIAIAGSRVKATKTFLVDFELGKQQGRYLPTALPGPFAFPDNTFSIGLCAHFLLLYDYYGLAFHIQAITEMLRICNEIRIYPTLNLHGQKSFVLDDVVNHFSSNYRVHLETVEYGFQGMGEEMLRIGGGD